jgi:hypothetical protein
MLKCFLPDGFSRILHINAGLLLIATSNRYCSIYREKQGEQIDQRYNITYFQGVLAARLGLLSSPVKQLPKIALFPTISMNFKDMGGGLSTPLVV